MNILLTGGTGFFGKALLRNWLGIASRGGDVPCVTVLSRSPNVFLEHHPEFSKQGWLNFHQGDILLPDSLPEGGHTHVLHAATDSTLGPQLSPLNRYIQIVDGTRNLLDFAATHRIPRLLLTSSGGVYGQQPWDMAQITENCNNMPDPLDPQNAYGVAKRCAEHLCALYQQRYGLETVVARCFAFVGRDLPRDAHFAIGNFVRDALGSSEIVVKGDGSAVRSYMDQRDLAEWLVTLLERGQAGQAYNVGSDVEINIHDLAYVVRDTLAPDKAVRVTGISSTNNSRNRYVPSIAKAQERLGLKLRFSLDDSLREMARYAAV